MKPLPSMTRAAVRDVTVPVFRLVWAEADRKRRSREDRTSPAPEETP